MRDLIERSDAIKAMQECFQILARQRVQAVKMIEVIPTIPTKQVKYFDEDERVWKIGSVIVDE